jgi:anaerobic magnesium-protoporphyrin IX monomethyl ester cyclase
VTPPPRPRFLFVVPPWGLQPGNMWRGITGVIPPIGAATLAAVLEREGVADAEILDAQALNLDAGQCLRRIVARAPDWIGFGVTTPIANSAYALATKLREHLPAARVVFGGPHPSALPDEPIARGAADYVLVGEAETTLHRLVAGAPPETIAGLVWKAPDGTLRRNPPPPLVADLDSLPDPAYEKLDIETYRPSLGNYQKLPSLGVIVTRGCYGQCSFCYRALFGSRVRSLSVERIIRMLTTLRDRHGVREIQFYDDVFLGTRARIRAFCEAMIEQRVGLTWSCFMRAELTDEETAGLMKRAGCYLVDFGIESADAAVLGHMRKNVALERTLAAVEVFRRQGMVPKCGFILGYPGETRETIGRTVDLAISLAPHAASFNLATPFPGTDPFAQCQAEGLLTSTDWDDYDLAHALIRLPDVSPSELLALYKEAYRRFYLRPATVLRWAARLRSPENVVATARAFFRLVSLVFLERSPRTRGAPGDDSTR